MSRFRCALLVPIALAMAVSSRSAEAQWYCPQMCQPAAQCCQPAPVCCAQPVVQACYQQVPVTEYRPVRQTVERPVYDVKYEDREVTAYRPVTETKSVNVPTVSYQNVTSYRSVCRNAGYWQTSYKKNCKVSPCQYDNRPGFIGWLNRTGYSFRSAFTPNYTSQRRYVPRQVVQQIPVTQQVAVRGMKRVTYNVTRMEPYRTTQKVAVRTVRMVRSERTVMKPYTVMRTVQTGTALAYAPFGNTATAYWPAYGSSRTADRYDRDRTRTARRPKPDPISHDKSGKGIDGAYRRDDTHRSSFEEPTPVDPRGPSAEATPEDRGVEVAASGDSDQPITDAVVPTSRNSKLTPPAPSIAKVSRWRSSRKESSHPEHRLGPVSTSPSAVAARSRN